MMMKWKTLAPQLEKIERTRTLSQKEQLLRQVASDPLGREVFKYTYSPKLRYYIKSPLPENYESGKERLDVERLWRLYTQLLEELARIRVRTIQIVTKVRQFLSQVPQPYLKWWVRILNRDLRLGVGEVLIKKYFPGVLPDIEVMKAYLVTQVKKLPPQVYIEPKYDGVRLILIQDEDSLRVYTRNGRRQEQLEDVLEKCGLPLGVYDSEGFLKDWNTTTSALVKEPHKLVIYVFDYISLEDYRRGKGTSLPLKRRKKLLAEKLKGVRCRSVRLAESYLIDSTDVNRMYERFIKTGYEGAMIKDPDSPYVPYRSTYWLKLKERDVDVYRVIEVLPGTGKYQNALGAIVVRAKDGTTFRVGSGFTDRQRVEFWRNPNEILGRCVEVALFTSAQKMSKAPFPTFIRLRPDVSSC